MAALQIAGLLLMILRLAAATAPFDLYVYNGGRVNNLTVAINVPQNATNDLYFHFQAPAQHQWAAFGFGNQMSGALMFVVYTNAAGDGVVVSPRLATGHIPPQFTSEVSLETFSGTDIVDGNYMVNARCTNCRKWNGAEIDVTGTSQSLIWAVGPATSQANSDDTNFKISQHDGGSTMIFSLDLQKATGEGGVPMVQGQITTNGTQNGQQDDGGDDGPSHFPIAFHAFLLIIAFLVIFPGGYLLLRLFERVWIHMAVQTVGLCFVLAGIITGIVVSQQRKISPSLNTPHQGLGLAVLLLTLTAWILGLVGHLMFKKTGQQKIPTKAHRGFGPLAILLGLVNVGLGFSFAGNTRRTIPFYIVTLIVFTLIGGFVYMINRRKMKRRAMETPAAQNFNAAFHPDKPEDQNVPMQTFSSTVTEPEVIHHAPNKVQ